MGTSTSRDQSTVQHTKPREALVIASSNTRIRHRRNSFHAFLRLLPKGAEVCHPAKSAKQRVGLVRRDWLGREGGPADHEGRGTTTTQVEGSVLTIKS